MQRTYVHVKLGHDRQAVVGNEFFDAFNSQLLAVEKIVTSAVKLLKTKHVTKIKFIVACAAC